MPEVGVEAGLELRRTLGLEVAVAEGAEYDPGDIARFVERMRRDVIGHGVDGARLYARGAVRRTKTELVEPAEVREEALLRDDPGRGELRVEHRLEVGAESAVPVGPDGAGEEEAIAEGDLPLDAAACRAGLVGRCIGELRRGTGDRDRARWQLIALGSVAVEDGAGILDAERGARAE